MKLTFKFEILPDYVESDMIDFWDLVEYQD